MKTIGHIAALLKQTMGLDMASVGSMLIERAVDERTHALGLADRDVYWLALQTTPDEMQALIEAVIVPETWFFRDREAILAVARLAYDKVVQSPAKTVRILSLPCSTGEEPYSIAIALLDAGVPANRFTIDAIDICHRSLDIARQGKYGRNSFRGKDLGYRTSHFNTEDMVSTVSGEVRRQVSFTHGNMFADGFLRYEPPYDFIFCRNVLIYFDRAMQQLAVNTLERLLTPDGTIFVGPAEAGIMLRPSFTSAGIALAFAFHRKPASTEQTANIAKTGHATRVVQADIPLLPSRRVAPAYVPAALFASDTATFPAVLPKKHSAAPIAPHSAMPDPQALMQRAIMHADMGELETASSLCKEYQHLVGPSAAGFYLMGLIADARNDTAGALQLYRKAVYMQPDHLEALTHIAALLTAQGDTAGALLMQQRAHRVKEQSHA